VSRILLCAMREYKATVVTKAFFLGAIVFPIVAWGAIFIATATDVFTEEKPPLEGTLVIVDGTEGQVIASRVAASMDPEARELRREQVREQILEQAETNPLFGLLPEDQTDLAVETTLRQLGLASELLVDVETLGADADLDALRERVRLPSSDADALLAFAVVGEPSFELPPDVSRMKSIASDMGFGLTDEQLAAFGVTVQETEDLVAPSALRPGHLRIVHRENMDPDYVSTIRRQFVRAVELERYLKVGIDPMVVQQYEASPPIADTRMVTEAGDEEDSTAAVQKVLPVAFFMLLYIGTLTGGSYLFYGTLEEKGSRVMEVMLSAVSAQQLMIGKIVGQGLVGLTVLGIYLALGLIAADRFGFLSAVPIDALIWMFPYFLMAYLFFGALYIAVGSAVTEIREASALQAPIFMLIVLIFVILFPILDNPDATVARVMSYFPPTTPFVMVMRMSQPAHEIPAWEIAITGALGVLGVVFTIWLAAKIFRVGVLMYGKPPSFGTLIKWVRQS
jgi:ABC-2 type transport system permease protein